MALKMQGPYLLRVYAFHSILIPLQSAFFAPSPSHFTSLQPGARGMPRGATQKKKNPYRSDTPSTGSRRRVVHHAVGAGGQREKNFTPFRGEGLCCPARKNLHYLLRSGIFCYSSDLGWFSPVISVQGNIILHQGPTAIISKEGGPGCMRGEDRRPIGRKSIPFALFWRGHVVEARLGVPLGT